MPHPASCQHSSQAPNPLHAFTRLSPGILTKPKIPHASPAPPSIRTSPTFTWHHPLRQHPHQPNTSLPHPPPPAPHQPNHFTLHHRSASISPPRPTLHPCHHPLRQHPHQAPTIHMHHPAPPSISHSTQTTSTCITRSASILTKPNTSHALPAPPASSPSPTLKMITRSAASFTKPNTSHASPAPPASSPSPKTALITRSASILTKPKTLHAGINPPPQPSPPNPKNFTCITRSASILTKPNTSHASPAPPASSPSPTLHMHHRPPASHQAHLSNAYPPPGETYFKPFPRIQPSPAPHHTPKKIKPLHLPRPRKTKISQRVPRHKIKHQVFFKFFTPQKTIFL
ncbi:hypothetical protein HNY73_004110 [Argiope bruennichi]|uniref:Uncharacterized protein n=1 Tax=Argiope bruennichi TaxID=94029 RepID=A0A8T0FNS2_ARGBR|nr:hypothetical protein HNY73_004110 [Argiope bruennichi]